MTLLEMMALAVMVLVGRIIAEVVKAINSSGGPWPAAFAFIFSGLLVGAAGRWIIKKWSLGLIWVHGALGFLIGLSSGLFADRLRTSSEAHHEPPVQNSQGVKK